ncbi:adenylyl-sulfate kinase [Burkholderia gladioli]|nr:adenylyl-sulfate kinase [Burkholderia gladioli]
MREHRRGIPLTRACHEFLCAADLPIAATNGMRRAIGVVHQVLDASGSGAAGLQALHCGAARVTVLCDPDAPIARVGSQQGDVADRLAFADEATLAAQGARFDLVLGPVKIGANGVDLHYGRRLESLLERFGTSRASVLPNTVRYSAQLVEWRDAVRLDADVAARARELGERYAVDFGPALERMAAVAPARERVRAECLRPLHASVAFLSCQPQSRGPRPDSAAVPPQAPASLTLRAEQPGRADAVVWTQELIHDGIVIGRARAVGWLPRRMELAPGEAIEVALDDIGAAMPLDDGGAAAWFAAPLQGDAQEAVVPLVFWLTGISGAGKTTIATRFEQQARARRWPATVLDGDALRGGLNADLGFSDADRAENVRRIAEVAALMADTGRVVIVSCISPKQAFRDAARAIIGEERFVEVFVDAPPSVAEARDPKGLYRRARAGLIASFTAIDSGYEIPRAPRIHIDTTAMDVESAARCLSRHYEGLFQPASRTGDTEVAAA